MKKINKILVGTHNLGKFKEISHLLPKKIKKISPIKLKIKAPKETGKTFLQNSVLKANYFYKKSQIISISDDSGLEVKCLNNKPGIYSARWGKKYKGFQKAMNKILFLVNKKKKSREAHFVCSLSIKFNHKKIISAVGRVKGSIANKIKGTNGFGYDAIFIPSGKKITYAQMSKKKKTKIDHRFIAYQKLKKSLKTL